MAQEQKNQEQKIIPVSMIQNSQGHVLLKFGESTTIKITADGNVTITAAGITLDASDITINGTLHTTTAAKGAASANDISSIDQGSIAGSSQ